ncbi:MAG: Asd/ArgC dimerization domain-containing protein, partial [Candidatus Micrarchaeaceae archaeon]
TPTYRPGSERSKQAVYGIPELNRDRIKSADLVSNPGCMATAAILSAYPLSHAGVIDKAVFDCKIGLSAVGSQPVPRAHYPSAFQSVYSYEKHPHRHYPEIRDALKTTVHFYPQIVPVSRGILCSAYLHLNSDVRLERLEQIYRDFYANDFFIRMAATPSTAFVRGSNFCEVGGFSLEDRLFVCSCAVDNLGKGGAGQAIQNMNLMLGFDEKSGLDMAPIFP